MRRVMRRVTDAIAQEYNLQSFFRNRQYRSWVWSLTLECGHETERRARYIQKARYETKRRESNLRPPPKIVLCTTCSHDP